MTAAEAHRFAALLQRFFAAQGRVFELLPAGARLDGQAAPAALAIDELAQECLRTPPREWEACLRRHFASRQESTPSFDPASPRWLEFAAAEPLLVAMLVPLSSVASCFGNGSRPGIVYRRDLDGLPTVLFFEVGTKRVPVERRHFAAWGRRPSELFRTALGNVRKKTHFVDEVVDLGEGDHAIAITAANGHAAHAVYFLTSFPRARGALGSLFTLDSSGRVLVAPVDAPGGLSGLGQRLLRASDSTAGAAGWPRNLYFWDGRRFYLQEANITGIPDAGSRKMLTGTP